MTTPNGEPTKESPRAPAEAPAPDVVALEDPVEGGATPAGRPASPDPGRPPSPVPGPPASPAPGWPPSPDPGPPASPAPATGEEAKAAHDD